MALATTLTKSARRAVIALIVAIATLLVGSTAGQTAGPMPPFQMPVPCGQTWDISTYKTHWNGDQDALDMAQRDTVGRTSARVSPRSRPPPAR